MSYRAFAGLEYLDTAVLAIDRDSRIAYANPAIKSLFALRDCEGMTLPACFGPASPITQAFLTAQRDSISITEHELAVAVTVTPLAAGSTADAAPKDAPGAPGAPGANARGPVGDAGT